MVLIREAESKIRSIRRNCKSAFDPETGAVNGRVIQKQAVELKQWLAKFETIYINEARKHPQKAQKITTNAREFLNEAWFTYEVLVELSMKANEAQPAGTKWEMLPSGVVPGELKEQVIKQLDTLYEDFIKFRKDVLVA